ncbi:MAG: hypothetical protein SGJ27_18350 [Candidatus Melainabacteria bacterium]|nr:hypothetical protein [Candidatus Melainabacteria bacterium]
MEALHMTPTNNANDCAIPFRIKDLMVGELLCQASVVTDQQLLQYADLARAANGSLGSALVFSNVMTSSELFVTRRLVNRYLNDSDNPERYLNEVRKLFATKKPKPLTRPSSISLAKITRRHAQVSQPMFMVS